MVPRASMIQGMPSVLAWHKLDYDLHQVYHLHQLLVGWVFPAAEGFDVVIVAHYVGLHPSVPPAVGSDSTQHTLV